MAERELQRLYADCLEGYAYLMEDGFLLPGLQQLHQSAREIALEMVRTKFWRYKWENSWFLFDKTVSEWTETWWQSAYLNFPHEIRSSNLWKVRILPEISCLFNKESSISRRKSNWSFISKWVATDSSRSHSLFFGTTCISFVQIMLSRNRMQIFGFIMRFLI